MTTNPSARKSILKQPSRMTKGPDDDKPDIAAQIIIPPDGGWGWVVVAASFSIMFIMDGVALTFGSLLPDIALELQLVDSLVALINSIAFALYFFAAPVASGFINRFGFRVCAMTGSILCSVAMLATYFLHNYILICIFHGFLAGCGYSFLNMSSNLIVGFYFEKHRALAFAIAITGSSLGVSVLAPLNTFLVDLAGWRTTTLLHASLFAFLFFISMSYRPLLSITVLKTAGDLRKSNLFSASKTSTVSKPQSVANIEDAQHRPTAAERLFKANTNFPTAAEVVEELETSPNSIAGPSDPTQPSTSLQPNEFKGQGLSQRQIRQLKSVISRVGVADTRTSVEIGLPSPNRKKDQGCCGRFCHWEKHVEESRPLYKDDAFYSGKVEKLPVYQKSMMDTRLESRTGLEYQLAVSRAADVTDLSERRGVFTLAFRRVLASMMDPTLMKRHSYLLFCCSAMLLYTGYAIPFVFIKDRNILAGVPYEYCSWFVSSIGIASIIGRLALISLVSVLNPLYIMIISIIIAGAASCLSDLSFQVYYQFGYCVIFGFSMAGVTTLRSLSLVELYGLDKLTNATGMIILFQGIGSLIGSPAAGELKDNYGYRTAFIFAGICIIVSGLILLPIRTLANKEKARETRDGNLGA